MSPSSVLSPSPLVLDGLTADHILAEIARCNGPQLPCYQARSILDGFTARFAPDEARAIVRQAFGVHQGKWMNAPVTVQRFTEENDSFFARPLLEEALSGIPGSS